MCNKASPQISNAGFEPYGSSLNLPVDSQRVRWRAVEERNSLNMYWVIVTGSLSSEWRFDAKIVVGLSVSFCDEK